MPKELDRLKVNIEIFAASDKYQELKVDENEELMEQIMKTVEKNYRVD